MTETEKLTVTHPTMIPIRAFRTPVRGHAFAAPPPGGERPVAGLPAELAREPDNPADPLAVAVWASPSDGTRWRIGYLDRGVAARLAPRLDAGTRVRAQLDGWSTEPEGRWRRPLLLLLPDDQDETDQDETQAPAGSRTSPATAHADDAPATSESTASESATSESTASEPTTSESAVRASTTSEFVTDVRARTPRPAASRGIWGRPPGVRRRRVA